jgi:hypothetical protein
MKVIQKQEQRWRRRLSWIRLIILTIAILLIIYGTITAVQSIPGKMPGLWASVFALLLGAASLIVGLISLLPLTGKRKPPPRVDNPTLVVYASENRIGQEVMLLLSEYWYHYPMSRSRHPEVEVQYIGRVTMKRHNSYGAVFKDLMPDRQYMFWTKGFEPTPITLASGRVTKIQLK